MYSVFGYINTEFEQTYVQKIMTQPSARIDGTSETNVEKTGVILPQREIKLPSGPIGPWEEAKYEYIISSYFIFLYRNVKIQGQGGDEMEPSQWESIRSGCYSDWTIYIELHTPISSLKNLSWWWKTNNSLIFQHFPSRVGFLRHKTWNKSGQQLLFLNYVNRIQYWVVYTKQFTQKHHIKLHVPTSSSENLIW